MAIRLQVRARQGYGGIYRGWRDVYEPLELSIRRALDLGPVGRRVTVRHPGATGTAITRFPVAPRRGDQV
jgi:hypothetical protein